MNNVLLFSDMTQRSKLDFFIKCQALLTAYHPTSRFIIREGEFEEKKGFILDLFIKYKGYCYNGNEVGILFNKIKVNDVGDPISSLKEHMFQPPVEDYNAISLDFAVYKTHENLRPLVAACLDPKIKFCLFVKNNEVKVYDIRKLLAKLRVS